MPDIGLIWDALLQKQIGDVSKKASETSQIAGDAGARVRHLEQRYEQLRTINMAMWNILKDRLQVTDADLVKYVEALHANHESGQTTSFTECKKCGRRISVKSSSCLYCGAATESAGTFNAT